jgi:hypothetical protein
MYTFNKSGLGDSYDSITYALDDACLTINTGSQWTRPNGTVITVDSVYDGTFGPMVAYTISGQKKIVTVALHWFMDNIVKTSK